MAHRDMLIELVEFRRPALELQRLVDAFPYDFDGAPVSLTRGHLRNSLARCIDGRISVRELEAWASLLEGRPGIDYEVGHEDQVSEVLFQLSTPDINGEVSPQKCWRLMKNLTEGDGQPSP